MDPTPFDVAARAELQQKLWWVVGQKKKIFKIFPLFDPNILKSVRDKTNLAVYFSENSILYILLARSHFNSCLAVVHVISFTFRAMDLLLSLSSKVTKRFRLLLFSIILLANVTLSQF